MEILSSLVPTDKNLFFTKNDPQDTRLGDLAISAELPIKEQQNTTNSSSVLLWGYPDDEGIALNGGRVGASQAPHKIREFLYKMTPELSGNKTPLIMDLGNVPTNIPLADRHELGRKLNEIFLKTNRILAFGGGHDYGYCESTGFASLFKNEGIIINFDAHLDVRPTDKGLNSGTPFRRLLTEFSGDIHFIEAGLQPQCNSQHHFQWAQQNNAKCFMQKDLTPDWAKLKQHLLTLQPVRSKMFISLDIDVFNSMEAPGCSQSWTTGLNSSDFFDFLDWANTHFDLRGLGIYEVSPALDFDNHTSKLAALIAHKYIHLSSR